MSSIGKTLAYGLHLFGQICTSQIATEMGRTAYALHGAVSHSTERVNELNILKHFFSWSEGKLIKLLKDILVIQDPHLSVIKKTR